MEIWLTFIVASTLILILPEPTIILVVSQAIAHGRKAALPLVIGVMLGDLVAMTASLLGLGTVMAASATLFTVFKWLGAAYLIYLGAKLFFSKPGTVDGEIIVPSSVSAHSLLRSSFVVTALNPTSIAFFVAFLPQFIDPTKGAGGQFLLYGTTFLVLATLNAALYAIFAVQLKQQIQREKVQRWFNRCGGCALVGAGVVTIGMKQAQ